jgi:hypothetical protein
VSTRLSQPLAARINHQAIDEMWDEEPQKTTNNNRFSLFDL